MPGSFGSLFLQVMLIYYYNKEEIARAAIDWLPLCEGAPAKRVGERTYGITLYPYTWCQSHSIPTIYTLSKSAIKTLSKKPKKVLDKGHTPCYNNQAVSREGQPLKLVATACMEILKPKGFKKYRKKFLTKELLWDIIYKLLRNKWQRSRTLKIEQNWNLWNLERGFGNPR